MYYDVSYDRKLSPPMPPMASARSDLPFSQLSTSATLWVRTTFGIPSPLTERRPNRDAGSTLWLVRGSRARATAGRGYESLTNLAYLLQTAVANGVPVQIG